MLVFVLQRLFQAAWVMLAVAFIAFLLFQYVGDPVLFMLGQDVTPEKVAQLRAELGLDQPFFIQFFHFVANAVQGDFGLSLRLGGEVSRLIAERLPATLELAFAAALLALWIGIPLGVYVALHRQAAFSRLLMTASLVGVSLPTFLIGILLILVFSVWLGWLPSFGRGEVVKLGAYSSGLLTLDGLQHLILPALTLSFLVTPSVSPLPSMRAPVLPWLPLLTPPSRWLCRAQCPVVGQSRWRVTSQRLLVRVAQ